MRIKEVRFEKLFSLAKYNNERIGFTAEIGKGDNPDKVVGQLHFKILDVEDCLCAYRRVINKIDYASEKFERTRSNLMDTEQRIKQTKIEIEELVEQSRTGDVDARLKHACSGQSYKILCENLEAQKKQLEEANIQLKKLVSAKETLRGRIKNGNFSLEDVDIPKARSEFY